jgi:hypothetical protein
LGSRAWAACRLGRGFWHGVTASGSGRCRPGRGYARSGPAPWVDGRALGRLESLQARVSRHGLRVASSWVQSGNGEAAARRSKQGTRSTARCSAAWVARLGVAEWRPGGVGLECGWGSWRVEEQGEEEEREEGGRREEGGARV